jgi:hypothetical protein
LKDDLLLIGVGALVGFVGARMLNDSISHHAALAPNQPNCLAGDPNCKPNPKQPSANAAPVKAPAAAKSARATKTPVPHVAAASGAVTIPFVPDTSCGGPPSGKAVLSFSINGVPVNAELDSGASAAVFKPATAAAVKLTTLPKAVSLNLGNAVAGGAVTQTAGFTAPVIVQGLPAIPIPIYTSPGFTCDVIPSKAFTDAGYLVTLSATSATFVSAV